MKVTLAITVFLAVGLFAGCSKKESPSSAASTPAPSAPSAPAKPAAPAGPRVVEIEAGDNMKFNVTAIEAKPGEEIKVVLKNIGAIPKEAMGHNWVLLKAGTDGTVFANAALAAKATDYIPDSMKDQVIVATKLIGPKETTEISFKAPTEPGDYPFLCSFPAHYVMGMKGTLTVK